MHRKSQFNIKIDFEKSRNSYLYDKNRKKYFLDFFGLYATLPLGYNHEIFKTEEFRQEYGRMAGIEVPNNEIISDEGDEFLKEFSGHKDMSDFEYFHFCCTGALAVESAIKVAIDQKKTRNPMVISLKESFHGINSYGGFVTDRKTVGKERLEGFPDMGWRRIHNPKVIYKDNGIDQLETQKGLEQFKREFNECLKQYGKENVVALLIEPIQSTYGDNYFPQEFFNLIRELCNQNNICLIFDEIQTGFGATGKMWYFQHLNIIPDIVIFGKKTQSPGIMVRKKFGALFEVPIRLEVTWDGHLSNMVRCKHILRAYQKFKILQNVNERSRELFDGLKRIPQLKNVRATGSLLCFDFDTEAQRNDFLNKAFERNFLCNRTRDIYVRLRPNLNVSSEEVREALTIIQECAQNSKVALC